MCRDDFAESACAAVYAGNLNAGCDLELKKIFNLGRAVDYGLRF
jgi:hypothetical protein